MNLLVFFHFEPKKCFQVWTPWGLYGAEWDERFRSFCGVLVVVAMSAVQATLLALWYPL